LYDTIYAHQDVKDDVKVGVKSIAVRHQGVAKALMGALGAVQVGLLASAGVMSGCGPVFYIMGCGGTAVALGYMIRKVDLESVDDCWYYFKWCAWVVGFGAVGGGLAAEYAAVRCGVYGDEGWPGVGGQQSREMEKLENVTSMEP
jgi:4-hydroxybenzoate polyprenyltransferase